MRKPRRSFKVGILVAGVADLLTYYLVLLAMRLSYVSYVGSVREMSVVLGAFLGSTFRIGVSFMMLRW